MCQFYPTSSYLFPDNCQNNNKLWGAIISAPIDKQSQIYIQNCEKCSKCGAFLIPQTKTCPLCDPQNFYNSPILSSSQEIKIGTIFKPKQLHVYCIAIDISLPQSYIKELINLLSSSNFTNTIEKQCLFMFVFLGQTPIYISMKDKSTHFSFGQIFNKDLRFIFDPLELNQVLEEASYLLNSCKSSSITQEGFQSFLDQINTIKELQSLILIHSFQLPNLQNIQMKFPVHTISVISDDIQPSFSIQQCLANGWSLAYSNASTQGLLNYLLYLLKDNPPKVCTIKIMLSEGIELAWLSSKSAERIVNGRSIEMQLVNHFHFSSFSFSIQPNNKYSSHSFFSIQIIAALDNTTIITNRVFMKASSTEEWCTSFNPMVLSSIYCRQLASHKLFKKSFFGKQYTWQIKNFVNSKDFKHSASDLFKTTLNHINTILFNDHSPLKDQIIDVILFQLISHGYTFSIDLSNSLLGKQHNSSQSQTLNQNANDKNFIYLPPFIFHEKNSKISFETALKLCNEETMPFIMCLEKEIYEKLKSMLSI